MGVSAGKAFGLSSARFRQTDSQSVWHLRDFGPVGRPLCSDDLDEASIVLQTRKFTKFSHRCRGVSIQLGM